MIVDLPRSVPGSFLETPKGMAVTPGALGSVEPEDEPVAPGFLEALGAHFRYDNIMFSLGASESSRVSTEPDPSFPGAWEQIKGTDKEQYWDRFVDVANQAQFDAVSRDIDGELETRRIIEATPWALSIPMTLLANVTDPTMLIPGGAFVRGAKGGLSVLRSALNVGLATGAAVSVQEAGLQATQQLRTTEESGTYIGASVLLGGLLGAGGAKLMSRAEWRGAVQAMERDIAEAVPDNTPFPMPVGAAAGAQRTPGADIDALTIAGRAAGATAKSTAWINPGLRLMHSESAQARDTALNLFESTIYLKGADQGIAAPRAVESMIETWSAGLAKASTGVRDGFSAYKKRVGSAGLSRREFSEAIGKAMRRGDVHEIPEVQAAAQAWRTQVFDPLKDAAIAAKLLPEDVSVDTAVSYFSRMYNRQKLTAEEHLFKNTVAEWLEAQAPRWVSEFEADATARLAKANAEEIDALRAQIAKEREARFEDVPGRAREIANEVYDKLTGRMGDGVRPYSITVDARGPLKARTFMIPDEMIERWLESDIDMVGRQYHRVMAADVELARRFGSVDMADQIKAIREDYAKLRAATTDEKKLAKLADAEKADIRDIQGVRDLIRGTFGSEGGNFARIARLSNMFNYIRSMGQVTLSSLPEAARGAMVHGLRPFVSTLGKINTAGFKMSVKDAKLAGLITERALSHRLATLAEINNFYVPQSPVETFMRNMVEVASSWNAIRLWTDFSQTVASVMSQSRILAASADFSKASARDKRYMAFVGIGEGMANRIGKQFDEFGEVVDGVRVANTERWTDAEATRAYYAALQKDIRSIVPMKSVADIPLFANTPVGRMIFQFNTFNLASHQRVLLRGLQEGPARFVSGAIALTSIGMMVTYLYGLASNREMPSFAENPGWWLSEGIDRSGLFMVPMQLANAFEKLVGVNPIKAPLKAFDESSAQSMRLNNRNTGSLLGPTFGMIEDAATLTGIPLTLAAGEEVRQGQKNAAERLLPFQSYIGLRQMLKYVVNPPEGQ